MASTRFMWSLEATKSLIYQYENYEFLYNIDNVDYKNRNKRLETYLEIANVVGNGCTHIDVKKKLNGLRTQYLAEKMKIANSVKSGADTDTIYKPTVYWFAMLKLLDASTSADISTSNLEVPSTNQDVTAEENDMSANAAFADNIEADIHERSTPNINYTQSHDLKGKHKRVKPDAMDSLLEEATSTMVKMAKLATQPKAVQSEEEEDIFGKFVASELKNMRKASNARFVRVTKRKIQTVLMSAWDSIDSSTTMSPDNTSSSYPSCVIPCTVISDGIVHDNAFGSSTPHSSQTSLWTSPGSTNTINEAVFTNNEDC